MMMSQVWTATCIKVTLSKSFFSYICWVLNVKICLKLTVWCSADLVENFDEASKNEAN